MMTTPLATLLALALLAQPAPDEAAIELAFLKGTFAGAETEARPIERGSLKIRVSSPSYELEVYRNLFTFVRAEEGLLDAAVEAELEGGGQLVARIEAAGSVTPFTDELTLPRQVLEIEGKIRLERTEGGYTVTLVELPETVELEVRSRALEQIDAACTALAALPFVPVNCSGLASALSRARLPLPEPGETIFLDAAKLTGEERAFFDRLAD